MFSITFSLVISFFAAELFLQAYFRFQNAFWLWSGNENFKVGYVSPVDDERQYVLRPGYENPRKGVSINEQGFRTGGGG